MRLPGSDVGMQEDLVGVGLPEEQFSGGLVEAGHGGREAEDCSAGRDAQVLGSGEISLLPSRFVTSTAALLPLNGHQERTCCAAACPLNAEAWKLSAGLEERVSSWLQTSLPGQSGQKSFCSARPKCLHQCRIWDAALLCDPREDAVPEIACAAPGCCWRTACMGTAGATWHGVP